MNTLQAELRRLYLADDSSARNPNGEVPSLITPDGHVRAMVLELAKPADWNVLSTVWQGVQTELELPAPAIAVSGMDGYQLWFSLAVPVSISQAQAFLESLRLRYLNGIAPERIRLMPTATHHADRVPALQPDTGLWSAFVAPDLAPIFSDSPGLDVCPNPEAQAKVLSRLACIKPAVFKSVVDLVANGAEQRPDVRQSLQEFSQASVTPNNPDPKRFLQNVMNDPTISMHLRIEAAKALLPFSVET